MTTVKITLHPKETQKLLDEGQLQGLPVSITLHGMVEIELQTEKENKPKQYVLMRAHDYMGMTRSEGQIIGIVPSKYDIFDKAKSDLSKYHYTIKSNSQILTDDESKHLYIRFDTQHIHSNYIGVFFYYLYPIE